MRPFKIFILLITSLFFAGFPASSHEAESAPETSSDIDYLSPDTDFTDPSISSSPEKMNFDLGDCVRMALRNNSEIRGANYDIQSSEWKLKQAQPRGTPVINYEYNMGPVPTDASRALDSFLEGEVTVINKVKVGVGVPVTTFGKLSMVQTLARQGILASVEKKKQKSSEVVLKVKQLYYGVLFAQELKGMLKDTSDKLGGEIAKRESTETLSDPIETTKLKLFHYDLLKRFGEVAKKEELALEGLRIQMGMDRGFPFQMTDAHLKPVEFQLKDLNFYLDEARKYRPESRLLDIGLKAKESEYRLEKRKLLPNLGIGGFFELGRTAADIRNVETTNDFNDPFNYTRAGVGLRLTGDLNLKEGYGKIKEKEAEYYKMNVLKDTAEEGLDLEIRDAYLTVRQALQDSENADKAQRLARQLIFLTKTNYDVGVGNKQDYAEALQSYLLMKGRYFEAVFNYNVAVASLMSKIGYQYE